MRSRGLALATLILAAAWAPGSGFAAQAPAVANTVVHLPVESAQVTVTVAVPAGDYGSALGEPGPNFTSRMLPAVAGGVRLELDETPVYVEEGDTSAAEVLRAWPSPFGAHPATARGENPPFGFAQDIGLGWHRGATAWWAEIQSEQDIARGTYNFQAIDQELNNMPPGMEAVVNIMLPERLLYDRPWPGRRQGLGGFLGGFTGGPPGSAPWMASVQGPPPGGGPPWPGAGPLDAQAGKWQLKYPEEDYLNFVRTLVARYDGRQGLRVSYWQFENEPDFSRASKDWEGYAHLQRITYQAIKEINPEATVLMGGLTGDFPKNFTNFFEPALAKLGGGFLDVFDIHLFGPDEQWRSLPGLYEQVRRTLESLGYGRVEIWMTECGTYTGLPAGTALPYQSEQPQARSLVKRLTYALNLGVKKVFWAWGIVEGFHNDDGVFDHTGLVYDGWGPRDPGWGVKKLGYHAYKLLNRKMSGQLHSLGRLDLGPGVVCLAFSVEGRRLYVLWAERG